MKLHELPKSTIDRKRVGRSISAGGGKTAGRGTKGQKSRTGKKLRYSFEGGQMPLTQRLPKRRGFRRITPKPVSISLTRLSTLGLKEVSPKTLVAAGVIHSEKIPVKIIGSNGAISGSFTFSGVTLSGSVTSKFGTKPKVTEKKTAPEQPAETEEAAEKS
jgi:large subunit ribosomal protein L15